MSGEDDGEDDAEALRKRLAKGNWLSQWDEVVKLHFQDEESHPQEVSAAEEALGFALTVIPNYERGHYATVPAQALAVAVALPTGGHLVKEYGPTRSTVLYVYRFSGMKGGQGWASDSLEAAAEKFKLPVPRGDES